MLLLVLLAASLHEESVSGHASPWLRIRLSTRHLSWLTLLNLLQMLIVLIILLMILLNLLMFLYVLLILRETEEANVR